MCHPRARGTFTTLRLVVLILRVPLSQKDDIAGLVHGPHVRSVAVLLGVDVPAHGGLTDDVEGTVSDQGEDVEFSTSTLPS